ncbi:hypothetical protein QO004_004839 [Rhizobium mesoamericanum]|uniref:DUF7007 domain-containing protein n=1 Tax=Rhizobium mesoamericanum TaxID=1079800 RepID=UPI00277DA316|nr:hypothetical protein [Rhizobium mesoamericanum]MDQ0563030.1 hypothetical protein [Rhizobium mesoamericanum]
MTPPPVSQTSQISFPDSSGVEFGRSADRLPVARVGDLIFAMVPTRDGQSFLASAWRVRRPLAALKRDDFYSHHGSVEDEAGFRARMVEQAEHCRELQALARQTVRMNCSTPWGPSQGATLYADGVVSHTTAGHGGFQLSAARNAKVHPMLRAEGGFYEQDAAWAIVALSFPELFSRYERKAADQTIRDGWPDAWEAIHGRLLAPGESHEKDRREFQRQHAQDWIVIATLRSDHHSGMTEVIATIGGKRDAGAQERRFLVSSGDYAVRRFGFVVDEAKHAACEGPSSFAGWRGRAA